MVDRFLQGIQTKRSHLILDSSLDVSAVTNAFHSNPFHCVQQASQATMALTKMLSRIVVRELSEIHEEEDEESSSDSSSYSSDLAVEPTPVAVNVAAHLHNHSFAISRYGSNGDSHFSMLLVSHTIPAIH